MSEGFRVPPLTEFNYTEWSYFQKQQLVLKGLASAIDPGCSIPGDVVKQLKDSIGAGDVTVTASVATTSTGSVTLAITPNQIEVVRQVINERAIALIRGNVSFNCSHLIGDANVSALEAWLNLETAFAAKLKARAAALKQEIQRVTLGNRSVGDYVGHLVRLVADLKSAGGTFSDEEIQVAILAGLPDSYQSVVDILSEQTLTTAELLARLQLAEGRRRIRQRQQQQPPARTPPAEAHAARGKGKLPKGKGKMSDAEYRDWVSRQKCRHCGDKGHLWKSCAKRIREEQNAGTGGVALANAFSALAM
jgi:hypothetical protein